MSDQSGVAVQGHLRRDLLPVLLLWLLAAQVPTRTEVLAALPPPRSISLRNEAGHPASL